MLIYRNNLKASLTLESLCLPFVAFLLPSSAIDAMQLDACGLHRQYKRRRLTPRTQLLYNVQHDNTDKSET